MPGAVKPRRMTRDDYAEAGVPSPHCPSCGGLPPCRCELNQIRGRDFTFVSFDELERSPIPRRWYEQEWLRCDNCGDETGECGCG